jgi:hypothetical protein
LKNLFSGSLFFSENIIRAVLKKKVVKIGEEILFKSTQNFLENPKRFFKILGTFPKKKVPAKSGLAIHLPDMWFFIGKAMEGSGLPHKF